MTTSLTHPAPPRTERMASTPRTVVAVALTALVVVGQLYATVALIDQLAAEFDTSPAVTTWASTAFGIAYAVGMLVAGSVSDAVGRRRIAVAGLLAGAAGALLVSASSSLTMLLVTRAVQGVATAFFPPAVLAYLTERIAPARRSTALTIVISAFLAAAVVAPLAASVLSAVGGWRTWFYASAAALVVLAGVLWRVLLPDESARTTGRRLGLVAGQLAALPGLLRRPRLVGLYLATLSLMFAYVGITTLVQVAGPGTAGDPAVMRVVRAATLPACVLVPLVAVRLARVSAPRRLLAAMGLVVVTAAATGFAGGPGMLAVALGAVTVGVAAAAPALVETIGRAAPAGQRGGATALYGFALFVGASLGAPAATTMAGHPYPAAALGIAAVVAAGGGCAAGAVRSVRNGR